MPTILVKKAFTDKYTKEVQKEGALVEVTDERLSEITETLGGAYISAVEIIDIPEKQDNPEKMGETDEQSEEIAYPVMIEKGKYQLSNGDLFEGIKKEAVKAEKALRE